MTSAWAKPFSGFQALWASWTYSTQEPSLFLSWMVRTYMPIYIACTHSFVKLKVIYRVPMHFPKNPGLV